MTNETNRETFALEARAEEIVYLSGDRRVRRGESDRLEVGSGPAQDVVYGTERARIGGHLSEHTGRNLSTQASRIETTVEGKLTQRFKSDTTLLGGTMTETYTGGLVIGAGMSDDLIIGGGVRVTAPADMWLCGLVGMEEKLGSAYADGALVELYRLAFEREYKTGLHLAGAAVLSGMVHVTTATGFRQYFKVAIGVRDLTPGGDAKESEAPAPTAAPAPAPAPPPGEEAASGGLLMAQGATEMEDMEDLAALEDIRHLFGDFDTTVDSGQTGNRAALLEDLGSLAKHSETGEDVGDAGRLANRLQDGAGLSDVVDAENLRTILGLGEGPETLDEARLVPDELVDSQVLDDNASLIDSVFSDPVRTIEDSGSSPRLDMGQHRTDLGLPVDFDHEQALQDFYQHYLERFREGFTPGMSEMESASKQVDEMILTHAKNLNPEWIDELGMSTDELKNFYMDASFAYQKMTDMADSARTSGDTAKADFLKGTLDNIDAQQYYTYQGAIERAESLREAALNSNLPETVHQDALIDALNEEYNRLAAEAQEIRESGDIADNPELFDRFTLLSEKQQLYLSARDAVSQGRDPVLYLSEMVTLSGNAAETNPARFAGSLEAQAELMQMFSDPAFGFTVDVGGMRSGLGVEDFDMSSAVTDMATRIDEYAVDSTPGTTVLRDAVDRADERALAQLENLPQEWLESAGLTDSSGALRADVRREILEDPGSAYRILTDMEADARAQGIELNRQQQGFDLIDEGTKNEDLEKADYLATMIARLDRDAKSEFESASSVAAALRAADNVPLTDDVNQAAMVEVIQEQLTALDARQAALDPSDPDSARELAQIEAERAFLNGALSRVQDGYDPGPRLREMLLVAQDATDSDAAGLENVAGAYQNVLDLLDDPRFRGVDVAGIDDAEQSGVVIPVWDTDIDPRGGQTPDESDLGRLGDSGGAGGNTILTDTEDPVYDYVSHSELRLQLDIDRSQLSLEDTSEGFENPFYMQRPDTDTVNRLDNPLYTDNTYPEGPIYESIDGPIYESIDEPTYAYPYEQVYDTPLSGFDEPFYEPIDDGPIYEPIGDGPIYESIDPPSPNLDEGVDNPVYMERPDPGTINPDEGLNNPVYMERPDPGTINPDEGLNNPVYMERPDPGTINPDEGLNNPVYMERPDPDTTYPDGPIYESIDEPTYETIGEPIYDIPPPDPEHWSDPTPGPLPEVSFDGLLAEWRNRIANADIVEQGLRPSGAAEIERAEAYSDVSGFMRQAVIDVSAGRDPRPELLRHAADLEARVFLDGASGEGEASMLRTMVAEYDAALSGA